MPLNDLAHQRQLPISQTCPRCQFRNDAMAQFCVNCGLPLNEKAEFGPSRNPILLRLMRLVLIFVGLAVAMASLYLRFFTSTDVPGLTILTLLLVGAVIGLGRMIAKRERKS